VLFEFIVDAQELLETPQVGLDLLITAWGASMGSAEAVK
jgi:hypothetical protein